MRKIRITNRALKILDRLKDRLIAKRKRSDRGHFETAQQMPLMTDAKAETGRHAEVTRVATRKPRVKVGGQREAEVAQIGGVGPIQAVARASDRDAEHIEVRRMKKLNRHDPRRFSPVGDH